MYLGIRCLYVYCVLIVCFQSLVFASNSTPDSLLKLTYQERFATINRLFGEAIKIDRVHANQLVDSLGRYFREHGTAEDQLLLRVCMITKGPEKPELFEG